MTVQIQSISYRDLPESVTRAEFYEEHLENYILRSAFCWLGLIDGDVACLVGLIAPTILSNQAYLWMKTTDIVEANQFIFVRHTQRALEDLLKLYPIIVGHCVVDSPRSIRWLKWLGAEFGLPEGRAIPFQIRAK